MYTLGVDPKADSFVITQERSGRKIILPALQDHLEEGCLVKYDNGLIARRTSYYKTDYLKKKDEYGCSIRVMRQRGPYPDYVEVKFTDFKAGKTVEFVGQGGPKPQHGMNFVPPEHKIIEDTNPLTRQAYEILAMEFARDYAPGRNSHSVAERKLPSTGHQIT